jgi:hypothetical protein
MRFPVFAPALVAAALLCCMPSALAGSDAALRYAERHGLPVQVGAELLGVSVPEPVQFDIHNDPPGQEWKPGDPIREIPRQHWDDPATLAAMDRPPVNPPAERLDWLAELQRNYDAEAGRAPGRSFAPGLNFEGAPGTTLPPDPSGDIGPNHYVQAVNASGGTRVRVYDKTSGDLLANFILTSQLQGGGVCSSGLGDPIVIYDALADRWVLTEFSPSNGRALCMYVSSSNDPTNTAPASWFRYTFVMPAFPDYPKYGVWSDAYYVGANEAGTNGARPVYAMERAAMLAGQPARFVRLTIPRLNGFGFQLLTPAHHTGATPPPGGAGGIFMRHVDDEAHFAGSNDPTRDYLQIWQLGMDWTQSPTPGAVLVGPQQVFIAEFNSRLNGLSAFEAFPQPNGQRLDPLREPIMNQMVYRNFGAYEAILGNLTTNLATDPQIHGAVRWFELRRVGGPANPWTLHQEGTYAPDDGANPIHRWMGASAMDGDGNIALGFSVTRQSPGVFPGLRRVGRRASDPLGVMTTGEGVIVDGSRSQSADRWGDYHQMGIDPVDHCTFWFTGEYMGPAGSSNNTRVASFKLDGCGEQTFLMAAEAPAQPFCAAPLPYALDPIALNLTALNGYGETVSLSFDPALPQGFSGNITPNQLVPSGSAQIALGIDATVQPGLNAVVVQGSDGGLVRSAELVLDLATQVPGAAQPLSPANGAQNVSTLPVLSWQPSAQARSYQVQVASDPAFANIVFSGSVENGNSIAVGAELAINTLYYWRVTAANVCGSAPLSATFQFRTRPPAGECGPGQTQVPLFSQNFNAGAGGFAVSGTGASNWALSNARPSPVSGGNAFRATSPASISDQRLTSPAIALPANQLPINLRFQNYRDIERNGQSACYDGGIVEVSTDGSQFTPVPASAIRNDPYRGPVTASFGNPLGDLNAWCNRQPVRNWADTLIDLSNWAGQTVYLRWRLGTDNAVGTEGWYVDDVRVDACAVPNQAPVADAQSVSTPFETAVAIVLTGSDPDGDQISFNAPSAPANGVLGGTAPNLTYTPNAGFSGADSFSFTVSDGQANSAPALVSITVEPRPNQAPVLDAPLADRNDAEGDAVGFSIAANFSDPDGDPLSFSVSGALPSGIGFSAGSFSGTLGFDAAGSYPITVTAEDEFGASVSDDFVWNVANTNRAPVAANDSYAISRNATLTVAAPGVLGNDSDPDADPLSAVLESGVSDGSLSLAANGGFVYTVDADFCGSDGFSYRASDGDLQSNLATVSIEIDCSNQAPVTTGIADQFSAEGQGVGLDISVAFSDPDGDELGFSTASPLPDGLELVGGVFGGILSFDSEGVYPITVLADDGNGGTVQASFTWTVERTNQSPVTTGIDDRNDTEGDEIVFDVTGAFSDPDGDELSFSVASPLPDGLSFADGVFSGTLSFSSAGSYPIVVVAEDGDGEVAVAPFMWNVAEGNQSPIAVGIDDQFSIEGEIIELDVNPAFFDLDGDELTLSTASALPDGLGFAGGVFSGTLSFDSEGIHPITVTADDGRGGTVDASFVWTVLGTNQAPITTGIANQESDEGDVISFDVSGAFSDPDGDELTLSTASALPAGLALAGGAFIGTLGFDAEGVYPITVTADDGNGGSVQASFTWTVNNSNRSPVVESPIANRDDAEGDAVDFSIVGNFSDPDGDVLEFTVQGGLPSGISFAAGSFSGVLGFDAAGTYILTVIASDPGGLQASDEFAWFIANTNRAPVAADDAFNTARDEALTVPAPGVLGNDSDPDGDGLSTVLVDEVANGSLALAGNGGFVYTPAAGFCGEDGFSYRASDGALQSGIASVTITIACDNQAPVAGSLADDSATELLPYSRDVSDAFSDPDGDELAFSATGLPASLTIDAASGVISGTPAFGERGAYSITVRASDDEGLFAEASFVLEIGAAAPLPDGGIFRDGFE